MAPIAKRRKLDKVEEITFDPAARQEYLTGFHKRKQQRIQHAREIAEKREKEEKVRERRQLREQRKEDLEKHIAEVNAELRKQNPDVSDQESAAEADSEDGGWDGIHDGAPEVAQNEEYVDENKFTTVTVQAMDGSDEESENDGVPTEGGAEVKRQVIEDTPKKRIRPKDPNKLKQKKKKFRYESKAERQATRQKQKSKNHAAKLRRTGKS